MKNFSQRKGLKSVSEVIQLDSMSAELRSSLWSVVYAGPWASEKFLYETYTSEPLIFSFAQELWFSYFKKPIDKIPADSVRVLEEIRGHFFTCTWNEVYDFLEFVVSFYDDSAPDLAGLLNFALEREVSGYRFVSGRVSDITDAQELEMLESALNDGRFAGVAAQLKQALELFSDRKHPDYRNSIKESISAVEGMASIVAEKPKATLGEALKELEKKGAIHTALKEGFLKIYGYTNDKGGIRHAMLEEPNLTAADARFFLLSCTSFVNYLKAQLG